MAIGSKSARMTLAEGLAFLTSAMSWIGPGPDRGGAEVADRRGLVRLGLQLLDRQPDPRRGDLATLGFDDFVEDHRRSHDDLHPSQAPIPARDRAYPKPGSSDRWSAARGESRSGQLTLTNFLFWEMPVRALTKGR